MKNVLYKMVDILDDIVDSGNMVLVQCVFISFTAISLFILIIFDGNNYFVQMIPLREMFVAINMVSISIAALLWLYHRIVRADSFR
jgi:hypothetical protein